MNNKASSEKCTATPHDSRRLQYIVNEQGVNLLTLKYDVANRLSQLSDGTRTVYYSFENSGMFSGLSSVSQIVATTDNSIPSMRWAYAYYDGQLAAPLYTIAEPSPTGNGISTLSLGYDSNGRVTSQLSSSGNLTTFTYGFGNTITRIFDKNRKQVDFHIFYFDTLNRGTGIGDAEGHRSIITYEDTFNPYNNILPFNPDQPTSIMQPDGKMKELQYDKFGNLTQTRE